MIKMIILSVLLAAAYLLFLNPHLDIGKFNSHDPAGYLQRARALWEGTGHGEIFANGFFAVTIQTPGFPLILAPVIGIFGANFTALKLFMLCLTGIFAFAAHRFFRYFLEDRPVWPALFLLMASPVIFGLAHRILAEIPLMICVVLGLLSLDRYLKEENKILSPWLWAAAASIAAAYFFKPTGLLVLLGGAFLFLHPRYRNRNTFMKLLLCGALIAIPVGIWKWWSYQVPPYWFWSQPTTDLFLRKDGNLETSGQATLADLIIRMRHNIIWGLSANLSTVILAPLYFFRSHAAAFLISVPVNLVLFIAWLRSWRKRPSVLEGFVFFNVMLLVVATLGMAVRYAAVLYPVILIYFLRLLNGWKSEKGRMFVLVILIAMTAGSTFADSVDQWRNPYGSSFNADYIEIAETAKNHLDPDSACRAPLISHWQTLTGHACYRLFADTQVPESKLNYYVILSETAPESMPHERDFEEALFKEAEFLTEELAASGRSYRLIAQNRSFAIAVFTEEESM